MAAQSLPSPQDYNVTVEAFHSLYLVDVEKQSQGHILNLNTLKNGEIWNRSDLLVFNTALWWYRNDTRKQWDFIRDGYTIVKDMNRTEAFRKGLSTWAKWIDSSVNTSRTKVFFQGVSPTHYHGRDWNDAGSNCMMETDPVVGSKYPSGLPATVNVVKEVLQKMKKRVFLLDVTLLSQLRKDAHPGMFNGLDRPDCTHWCIAGLPDTWNQILYALLVYTS